MFWEKIMQKKWRSGVRKVTENEGQKKKDTTKKKGKKGEKKREKETIGVGR